MKRISLITIFDNPNFGTYLQALALGVTLEKFNTKVEIVHYERPAWHEYSAFRKKVKVMEPLWEFYYKVRRAKGEIQRVGCRKFVSKYIRVTKPYYSDLELMADPPVADIYITGSDQVWNTVHNHGVDGAFYLSYAPKGRPRYAYASSIGMEEIPIQYIDTIKDLLSRYSAISVREESNVRLLKQIGIESQMVLDPTFLIEHEEWIGYAKKMSFDEKYVLAYSVESRDRDIEVGSVARRVADRIGCKLYEVSYFGPEKSIPFCDRHFYYATPDVFLSLVSNACFIVGSSFHITAFAINFRKPFITVAPDRFSSRIDSLLRITHLENRKITGADIPKADSMEFIKKMTR